MRVSHASNLHAISFPQHFGAWRHIVDDFPRPAANDRDVKIVRQILTQLGEQLPRGFHVGPVGAIDE